MDIVPLLNVFSITCKNFRDIWMIESKSFLQTKKIYIVCWVDRCWYTIDIMCDWKQHNEIC